MRENEIIAGNYKIIREIGHGGTGTVFLGYHLHLQKYVVDNGICTAIYHECAKDGFLNINSLGLNMSICVVNWLLLPGSVVIPISWHNHSSLVL